MGLQLPLLDARQRRAARLINHLGSLGQRTKESEEEKEAATVAALIGGTDAGSAYKMATDNFRAIPLCQITKADLKSNADTNMAEKTEAVAFGDVAAFITHSWQDPGDQKFEALQEWGDEYREKNGGKEPLVWLDKACVNQPTSTRPSPRSPSSSPAAMNSSCSTARRTRRVRCVCPRCR